MSAIRHSPHVWVIGVENRYPASWESFDEYSLFLGRVLWAAEALVMIVTDCGDNRDLRSEES